MPPTSIDIFTIYLSLLLLSGYGAAADVVIYDKPTRLPIVLTCRSEPAKGPVDIVYWSLNNNVVASTAAGCKTRYCLNSTSLYDLVITSASRADAGTYNCQINYLSGNITNNYFSLVVRDLPGLPTIAPPGLDMIEGHAFIITCQSLGGYPAPNITWYKGGVLLQSNVSVTSTSNGDVTGTVSFVPSYADDGAPITCVAENVLGSNNSTAQLNVSYGPRDILLKATAVSVVEGGAVTLTCSAKGKPMPSISWSMPKTGANGTSIQLNNSIGVSYLYVGSIQRQAAGIYVCTASNILNQTFNLSISSNVTMDVQYVPIKPVIYPSSFNFSSGDNISLTCNVTDAGNPAALYNWTKDGLTIRVGLSTGALTLPFVNLTSSGAYVCTAYNSAGATAADMCNISVFAKPVIAPGPGPTVGYIGKPVALTCSAYGNPRPTITWTKNMSANYSWNVSTVLNSSVIFTVNSLLRIASVSQDDYGTYTCFANSSYGNDSASFDVIAPAPPLPPSNMRVVAAQWSTLVLSWNASYDGGYEQVFSVYLNSSLKYNGSNTSCTVTGLSPGNYIVYVYAKNYVGTSNSSELVVATVLEGPSAGSLSLGSTWSLPFQPDAQYCVEVKCDGNTIFNNCTQSSAELAKNIQCAAAQARWCLASFQDVVCGSFSNFTKPAVPESSQPALSQNDIIIIVCVVVGSVLLIVIVITAVCCARRRGNKKTPPASLIHNSQDFSQSGTVRLSAANETPYATYVRDQVYANPNFVGEGEDDLSQDGTQLHDQNLPNSNPQHRDYIYASVGVKRQPASVNAHTAKGVSGYDMHDFDELDGSHRDDSSSVSEPPPYHPQISVADSDATSATDSKQTKRVLYEVIV